MKRDMCDTSSDRNATQVREKRQAIHSTQISTIIVNAVMDAIRNIWKPIDSTEDAEINSTIRSSISVWAKINNPNYQNRSGKLFYDIEVRSSTSLYHRYKRRIGTTEPINHPNQKKNHDSSHQICDNEQIVVDTTILDCPAACKITKKRFPKSTSLTVRSPYGVERQFKSPYELSEAILPTIEEVCLLEDISQHVRIHPSSGFITIATYECCATLQSIGFEPCSYCPQWCRGRKGLWWHLQQQHNINHAVASSVASSMSPEKNLAITLYINPQRLPNPTQDNVPMAMGGHVITKGRKESDILTTLATQTENHQSWSDIEEKLFFLVKESDFDGLKRFISEIELNVVHKDKVQSNFSLQSIVDKNGASLLLWAAGGGCTDIVRYFVEQHNMDPNFRQRGKRSFRGRTALHWSARNGHYETVQYLLSIPASQAYTTKLEGEARLVCTEGNHVESVLTTPKQRLVDINATTVDGTTAFCWAAWQGHFKILKLLHNSGCDVNIMNSFGCNPVLWAAQGELVTTTETETYLSPAVDISSTTKSLMAREVHVIKYLESIGCEVYILNNSGHGVLHKAAQRGRAYLCQWFIEERILSCVSNIVSISDALHGGNLSVIDILNLIGPDNDLCTPSDLAGMEEFVNLAISLAEVEEKLVELLYPLIESMQLPLTDLPEWLQSDALPANNKYDHLRFEPMAGVLRMRNKFSRLRKTKV